MTIPTQDTVHEASTPKRFSPRAKAIIAIAAGTALLLGGAGSYAYWSTSQSLNAGTVNTGDLNLALGAGTWSLDGTLTAPTTVADPSAVHIVPGDVLTLTQVLDVTLVGDNLEALLTADLSAVIPVASASYLTATLSVTGVGTPAGVNTYRLTPADAAAPINAVLTITFNSTTPNRESVNTPIDLTALAFTLTQASS